VAGGGADGAGPLQGELQVVELALRLRLRLRRASQRRARGDGAQAGGCQRPDRRQYPRSLPRRRCRHRLLSLAAQYDCGYQWLGGCVGAPVSLATGPAPPSQVPIRNSE
jgi:hypothetical protein